jgi:AraC-like DNA-binding protein
MKIFIKNMVCPRCIKSVHDLLTSLGYNPTDVRLGYAVLDCDYLSKSEQNNINDKLTEIGFELLADEDTTTVERIKIALLEFARTDGGLKIKLSQAMEDKFDKSYKNMASLFSKIENRTIENYFIEQRIEYVKELISYGDQTLTDIAFKTGYSSVAYLSKQFAQVVGMTITEYRNITSDMRRPLTEV